MKAMISLDGLLALIHKFSLSASNKRWLGEKLLEEARAEEAEDAHVSASKFYGVWKEEDYPDWSADHINLGLEDAWTEENADDVHSGSYALRAGNAGLSWSNSTTGNTYDRAIKMRGLEIEPETSFRVTFWAKAPATYTSSDGASTDVTAIKSTLSVGIENVEAPFVSQSGTTYYYNWTGSEDVPVFEDDWKCFSFVAYYSGKDVL